MRAKAKPTQRVCKAYDEYVKAVGAMRLAHDIAYDSLHRSDPNRLESVAADLDRVAEFALVVDDAAYEYAAALREQLALSAPPKPRARRK